MSYAAKQERVFGLPGEFNQVRRSDHRLKKFSSTFDKRAWHPCEEIQYAHLYDLMTGSQTSLISDQCHKYVPLEDLIRILMAEKDALIKQLQDQLKNTHGANEGKEKSSGAGGGASTRPVTPGAGGGGSIVSGRPVTPAAGGGASNAAGRPVTPGAGTATGRPVTPGAGGGGSIVSGRPVTPVAGDSGSIVSGRPVTPGAVGGVIQETERPKTPGAIGQVPNTRDGQYQGGVEELMDELNYSRNMLKQAMKKLQNIDEIMNENKKLQCKLRCSTERIKFLEEKKRRLECELADIRSKSQIQMDLDKAQKMLSNISQQEEAADMDEVVLQNLTFERDELQNKVQQLEKELEDSKKKETEMEKLKQQSQSDSLDKEEMSRENECFRKKLASMKCLEKQIQELKKQARCLVDKYKKEALRAAEQMKRMEQAAKELQALRDERESLCKRVRELASYEKQYNALVRKLQRVDSIIAENENLNSKLVTLQNLEKENEYLRCRLEMLQDMETHASEDKERIAQLQCAVADQEEEMKDLLSQIEKLTNGTHEEEIERLKCELYEKNSKLKLCEEQLAEIPMLEAEIDELRMRLQCHCRELAENKTNSNTRQKIAVTSEEKNEENKAGPCRDVKEEKKADKVENNMSCKEVQGLLNSSKNIITCILEEMIEHQKEMEELEKYNKAMKEEINKLKEKVQDSDKEALLQEINKLKSCLKCKDLEISRLKNRDDSKSCDNIETLRRLNEEMKCELKENVEGENLGEVKSSLSQESDYCKALQKETNDLKLQIEALNKLKDELKRENELLRELQKPGPDFSKQLDEKCALENLISLLQAELEAFEGQKLGNECEALRNELKRVMEQNCDLKTLVNCYRQRLNLTKVSEKFGTPECLGRKDDALGEGKAEAPEYAGSGRGPGAPGSEAPEGWEPGSEKPGYGPGRRVSGSEAPEGWEPGSGQPGYGTGRGAPGSAASGGWKPGTEGPEGWERGSEKPGYGPGSEAPEGWESGSGQPGYETGSEAPEGWEPGSKGADGSVPGSGQPGYSSGGRVPGGGAPGNEPGSEAPEGWEPGSEGADGSVSGSEKPGNGSGGRVQGSGAPGYGPGSETPEGLEPRNGQPGYRPGSGAPGGLGGEEGTNEFQETEAENANKLKKLVDQHRRESENREKIYNENLGSMKSDYETGIRKLSERHKQSVARLQELHQDEIQEINSNYEAQLEMIQSQSEAAIKEISQTSAAKIQKLNSKHSKEIAKLQDALTESQKELETLKRQGIGKGGKDLESEMKLKQARELQKIRRASQQKVNALKSKFEESKLALEGENESLQRSLKDKVCECSLAKKKLRKPRDPSCPLDFTEVLEKILEEGLDSLSFNEIALVHRKTCCALEGIIMKSDLNPLVMLEPPVQDSCPHLPLLAADKEQLLNRIFALENEINQKQKQNQDAIINMELAIKKEKLRLQEVRNLLENEQQRNSQLKMLICSQSKVHADLKRERDRLGNEASMHQMLCQERQRQLNDEIKSRKYLEMEIKRLRCDLKRCQGNFESEREKYFLMNREQKEHPDFRSNEYKIKTQENFGQGHKQKNMQMVSLPAVENDIGLLKNPLEAKSAKEKQNLDQIKEKKNKIKTKCKKHKKKDV